MKVDTQFQIIFWHLDWTSLFFWSSQPYSCVCELTSPTHLLFELSVSEGQ